MKCSKLLLAGVLSLSATLVNAATIFEATDSDINVGDAGFGLYAIFDNAVDLAAGTPLLAIVEGNVIDVTPAPPSVTTLLTRRVNPVNGTASLTITSGNFVFGGSEDGGTTWILGDGVEKWYAGSNQWDVTFAGSSTLTLAVDIIDVTAVPVPAAVWLFGSGLIGLVGVARRRA